MSKMSDFQIRLQEVKEDMCDNYCKYPYQYQMEYEDPEEGFEEMLSDICADCPLNRL